MITPLWPLQKPRMMGKNFAVSTGFLPKAGSNCYQVPHRADGSLVVTGFHTGIDLNGPEAGDGDLNETIQAVLSGTVAYSGFYPGWGNITVVELDDKSHAWAYRIAHMPHLEVGLKQRATRGQRIGGIGKGPNGLFVAHLHFDLWAMDLGRADRWNGGLKDQAAFDYVKSHYVSPKAFYAAYGITNLQHEGGCPL